MKGKLILFEMQPLQMPRYVLYQTGIRGGDQKLQSSAKYSSEPVLRFRDVWDPESEFFHPGSRIKGHKDSGSRTGSASLDLSIFNSDNCS
jgi:hypothetical protein